MSQYLVPFKTGSKVLEVGGGEHPLYRPNHDMRRLPTVDVVCNLEERWPVEDSSYDGVFGKYIIEHIGWRRVPFFVSEAFRVLKPGGLAVFIGPNTLEQAKEITRRNKIDIDESSMLYGGQEQPGWNQHKSAFSFDYGVKIFKEAGFERVDVKAAPASPTDMIIEAFKGINPVSMLMESDWYRKLEESFLEKPTRLKLNIGSYTVMFKDWINIDVLDMSSYARENNFTFKQIDVRYGLPYSDKAVEIIVASHLIEHLNRDEGARFLKECNRALMAEGVLRLTVPDARLLAEDYVKGTIMRHSSHNEDVKKAPDEASAFLHLLMGGHQTIYDYDSLRRAVEEAGLINVERSEYGKSRNEEIVKETRDMYPELSLYLEATKPAIPVAIKRKLRIGLISTQFFGVPPKGYSGLEMVVWDLALALDQLGHEVTVFAPKGSQAPPHGRVVETGEALNTVGIDWVKAERDGYEVYKDHLKDLDIIHGHNWFGFEYLAKAKDNGLHVCHTHHGGLNLEWWGKSRPPFKLNLIGISKWMSDIYRMQGIESKHVYNGVDLEKYQFKKEKGDRLLYVGRIDKFKQPHVAIEVAKKLNMGLDLVGGTFVQDPAYLEEIRGKCVGNIRFYPDAPHEKKIELMQNAKCLLFPSAMGEPFGLVAVEAMACGTPVIAINDGAIGEVVLEGGTVCEVFDKVFNQGIVNYKLKRDPVEAMADAVRKLNVNPESARKNAELFSRENMAGKYVELYMQILNGEEWSTTHE